MLFRFSIKLEFILSVIDLLDSSDSSDSLSDENDTNDTQKVNRSQINTSVLVPSVSVLRQTNKIKLIQLRV